MKPIQIELILGHKAAIRDKPTGPEHKFTHDWEVYIKADGQVAHVVDRVIFHLHETFPQPKRVVKEPPFCIKESGYAGFELKIEVCFKTKEEPRRTSFVYDLFLQEHGGPIANNRRERVTFHKYSKDFGDKLLTIGGVYLDIKRESSSSSKSSSQAAVHNSGGKSKPNGAAASTKEKEPNKASPKNTFETLFGIPIKKQGANASSAAAQAKAASSKNEKSSSSSSKAKDTTKEPPDIKDKPSSSSGGSKKSDKSSTKKPPPPEPVVVPTSSSSKSSGKSKSSSKVEKPPKAMLPPTSPVVTKKSKKSEEPPIVKSPHQAHRDKGKYAKKHSGSTKSGSAVKEREKPDDGVHPPKSQSRKVESSKPSKAAPSRHSRRSRSSSSSGSSSRSSSSASSSGSSNSSTSGSGSEDESKSESEASDRSDEPKKGSKSSNKRKRSKQSISPASSSSRLNHSPSPSMSKRRKHSLSQPPETPPMAKRLERERLRREREASPSEKQKDTKAKKSSHKDRSPTRGSKAKNNNNAYYDMEISSNTEPVSPIRSPMPVRSKVKAEIAPAENSTKSSRGKSSRSRLNKSPKTPGSEYNSSSEEEQPSPHSSGSVGRHNGHFSPSGVASSITAEMKLLRELHVRINSLDDPDKLQKVVDIVEQCGRDSWSTDSGVTFDFDLCKLNSHIIRKLQHAILS